tara:strand:- start:80 stop:505 length:426 start_codon:yes stop_codon:yes gene_type:complete
VAKERGTKVLLKIGDGASPEVFSTLAGQQDTRMAGASNPIDVGAKEDGDWGATLGGIKNMTVTATGIANWPDTTGLEAIRVAWQAGTDINCRVVLSAAGQNYVGPFQVTQFDVGGTHTGATEYSITVVNNGAPTYAATEPA